MSGKGDKGLTKEQLERIERNRKEAEERRKRLAGSSFIPNLSVNTMMQWGPQYRADNTASLEARKAEDEKERKRKYAAFHGGYYHKKSSAEKPKEKEKKEQVKPETTQSKALTLDSFICSPSQSSYSNSQVPMNPKTQIDLTEDEDKVDDKPSLVGPPPQKRVFLSKTSSLKKPIVVVRGTHNSEESEETEGSNPSKKTTKVSYPVPEGFTEVVSDDSLSLFKKQVSDASSCSIALLLSNGSSSFRTSSLACSDNAFVFGLSVIPFKEGGGFGTPFYFHLCSISDSSDVRFRAELKSFLSSSQNKVCYDSQAIMRNLLLSSQNDGLFSLSLSCFI